MRLERTVGHGRLNEKSWSLHGIELGQDTELGKERVVSVQHHTASLSGLIDNTEGRACLGYVNIPNQAHGN